MRRGIPLVALLTAVLCTGGCWLFASTPEAPPTGAEPPELLSVTFEQVDWFESDGTSVQANSLWCLMSWTYTPTLSTTFYLNVRAALTAGDSGAWVIRNLPLFPASGGSTAPRREAAYINLADLGLLFDTPAELVIGFDIDQLAVSISVGAAVLNEYEVSPSEAVSVGTSEHRASGIEDESPLPGPFADPGEPARIDVDGVPIAVNTARDVRAVQEGSAKCAAGAFARSLDWLNREHDLGLQKTAQQIYQDLIRAGVSEPNTDGSPARDEWIARKNEYAREQTENRIVTKVWDHGTNVDPIEDVTEENGDFAEWLKREIRTEDVEVAYYYPGNAHIVTVLQVYTRGGSLFVKYRDDERQDDNAHGDAAVKHARIYKVGDTYRFGTDRNRVYFAVSESVVDGT
jgi:hypothetical protein